MLLILTSFSLASLLHRVHAIYGVNRQGEEEEEETRRKDNLFFLQLASERTFLPKGQVTTHSQDCSCSKDKIGRIESKKL